MKLLKRVLTAMLIVFVAMQFSQPARNKGLVGEADITKHFFVPADVGAILKISCYDCHSNNTRYPWYANLQPMGWVLADHIKDGKAELNFDEFGSYSKRRQLSKLKSITGSVKDGSMPITSYTWMHSDARLSAEDKTAITGWATKARDSLPAKN